MALNSSPDGACYEVFTAAGSRPVSVYTSSKTIHREYDRSVKGLVMYIEGSLLTQGQLRFPRDPQARALALSHSVLALQLWVGLGQPFYLEIEVSITGGSGKRRLILSSSTRERTADLLHVRLPDPGFPRDQWMNLCLDLPSLVQSQFPSMGFRSLDSIAVGPVCRLRRVFTLRKLLMGPSELELQPGWVPKAMDFPVGVTYQSLLLACPLSISESSSKGSPEVSFRSSHSASPVAAGGGAPKVAFGRTLAVS